MPKNGLKCDHKWLEFRNTNNFSSGQTLLFRNCVLASKINSLDSNRLPMCRCVCFTRLHTWAFFLCGSRDHEHLWIPQMCALVKKIFVSFSSQRHVFVLAFRMHISRNYGTLQELKWRLNCYWLGQFVCCCHMSWHGTPLSLRHIDSTLIVIITVSFFNATATVCLAFIHETHIF